MKRQFLRITLVRTTRTDLMCIACGKFRAELAVVSPGGSDVDALVGVHKRVCANGMHSARGLAKRQPAAVAGEVAS